MSGVGMFKLRHSLFLHILRYNLNQFLLFPPPTKEEIEEFRRLLERAREYDKKNDEPDCEKEEKKQKLMQLAKQLNIEIAFV